MLYKHSILQYKVFNYEQPTQEWSELDFTQLLTSRLTHLTEPWWLRGLIEQCSNTALLLAFGRKKWVRAPSCVANFRELIQFSKFDKRWRMSP